MNLKDSSDEGPWKHWQHPRFTQRTNSQITSAWINRQRTCVWDRLTLSEIGTGITFFQVPIMGHCPYTSQGRQEAYFKSATDTSMVKPEVFPPPQCLLMDRLSFTFAKETPEREVYAVAERCVARFRLDEKFVLKAPMISMQTEQTVDAPIRICNFCQACFAAVLQCPGCGAREFRFAAGNAQPGRRFFLELAFPIYIAPLQQFGVELLTSGPTYRPSEPVQLWCQLDGDHDASIS